MLLVFLFPSANDPLRFLYKSYRSRILLGTEAAYVSYFICTNPVHTVTKANGVVQAIQLQGSRVNLTCHPSRGQGMASNCGGAPADERQCICAPTTHTGSFRCRLHRGVGMPRSASCQQLGDAGAGLIVQAEGRLPAAVRRALYHRRRRHVEIVF